MLCKHYGKEQNNSSIQQNLKNLNLSIDSVDDDDDAQEFPSSQNSHEYQNTVPHCAEN